MALFSDAETYEYIKNQDCREKLRALGATALILVGTSLCGYITAPHITSWSLDVVLATITITSLILLVIVTLATTDGEVEHHHILRIGVGVILFIINAIFVALYIQGISMSTLSHEIAIALCSFGGSVLAYKGMR